MKANRLAVLLALTLFALGTGIVAHLGFAPLDAQRTSDGPIQLESVTLVEDAGLEEGLRDLRDPTHLTVVRVTDDGLKKLGELRGKRAKNLRALTIHGWHRISDTGLAHLSELTDLTRLSIMNADRIDGSGLACLAKLTKLEELRLPGARRIKEANLAPVWKLPALEVFELSHAPALVLSDANALPSLKKLRRLDISGSGATNETISQIANLKELTSLNLAGCKSISSLAGLSALTKLLRIDLTYCAGLAKANFKEQIKQVSVVQEMSLGDLVEDEQLQPLADFPNLVKLEVDVDRRGANWFRWRVAAARRAYASDIKVSNHYAIKDAGLSALNGFDRLNELDLSGCYQITNRGLQAITDLPNIKILNLSQCIRVSNKGIKHVSETLKTLERLDLSFCERIQPYTLDHLPNLKNLKFLDLNGCDFLTKESVTALRAKMPNCVILSDARPEAEMEDMGGSDDDDDDDMGDE